MLMSQLLGERLKEKPADATASSHIFLVRGGYVRQVSNGIYTMMLPATKIKTKIENIIREEMNKIEGQEVLFPVVLPGELWKESGRFDAVGSELLRVKDRAGKDMLLAMTHEEAAVHLARTEARSYAQYPFMIYQIQTKFRDEPRARGGLIRVREFTMKDAYSFHTSQEDLEKYYDRAHESYDNVFRRAGIPEVISVASDTGMMGGKVAHEFMFLSDIGEDTLVVCDSCDYQSNMEVATSKFAQKEMQEEEVQKLHTPGIKTIEELAEFCSKPVDELLKATIFEVEGKKEPLIVFVRGDKQVNEAKLSKVVQANITPFTRYDESKIAFGFVGPKGLDTEGGQVIFDESLKGAKNLVCGANEIDYHFTGVSIERDINPDKFYDISEVIEGETCPCCTGKLQFKRGVEVGNIFQLGTKYTTDMNMTYTDQNGKAQTPIMGCYGIGVGRLMACIIEAHHDEYGPIWPISVAPWDVHVCVLKSKKQDLNEVGMDVYNKLKKNHDVILDDRGMGPGAQFADADLLGVPVRVIIGERNLKNNEVEICTRDKSIKKLVDINNIEQEINDIVEELKRTYK